MTILGCIPARYGSSRLPGKPLVDIAGKPMILHVLERASQAQHLDDLICLTDDERIMRVVVNAGYKAALTSSDCQSGTDRLVEFCQRNDADIIVNIQGDEVLLESEHIDHLVSRFIAQPNPTMATLAYTCKNPTTLHDPTTAKVVCDLHGSALYFSRQCIPVRQDGSLPDQALVQLGMYAYTRQTLLRFATLSPSPLETAESLEQLRALQNNIPIYIVPVVVRESLSVDTDADLARARELLTRKENPSVTSDLA